MEDTMDIYDSLLKGASDLRGSEEVDYCGLDECLNGKKIKVASLSDLSDFFRIATDTLVHKAEKDLWRISEDGSGQVVIERLFDPATHQPIKV